MRHRLPPLHYAVDALEPCIDTRTMTLHRETHHQGYVDKLNAAVAGLPSLRAEYLRAWWAVVDWTEASRRLEDRDRPAAPR